MFSGEVKSPYSEPTQPLLNAIADHIKVGSQDSMNFIIEEIIKNPRILINKNTYDPVVFKPGMHSNIVHLICEVFTIYSLFLAYIVYDILVSERYTKSLKFMLKL